MGVEQVRQVVSRLAVEATGLAALGLALQSRASVTPLDPRLAQSVAALVATLGVDTLDDLSILETRQLLGEIRTALIQAAGIVTSASVEAGWSHQDETMLVSIGDASALFARLTHGLLIPALPGLGERLASPDAAFLDVGVGVGSIAMAMAQTFPNLRVVGIDPWPPARAIAQRRVDEAGLSDRVEIRAGVCETLEDVEAFDLVFFPGPFVNRTVLPAALERLQRAIRPGGWLAFGLLNLGDDPLKAAVTDFRSAYWGGGLSDPAEAGEAMTAAGFQNVQPIAVPPTAMMTIVAARRA